MEAENKKDAATEKFLLTSTDTLQPLLDIMFFRYWDIAQVRADGERKIKGEQTNRLVNDLLRVNEDVAVTALKDYLKYKLYSGNDAVKEKKEAMAKADETAALSKFDLETKIKICKINADAAGDVETALEAAQTAKADVKDLEKEVESCKETKEKKDTAEKDLAAAVEGASPETVQQLEKACRVAKDYGSDTLAAEDKLMEMQIKKKLKDKEEDAKSKEHRAYEGEKRKTIKEQADAKKAEALKKLDEEREEEKKKLTEDTKKASEDGFTSKWKEACDAVAEALAEAYHKAPFTNRQAADTEFRGLISDPETITHNELNKIFNLDKSENFDKLCTSLGFKIESYDDALKKLSPEEEEKDAESK